MKVIFIIYLVLLASASLHGYSKKIILKTYSEDYFKYFASEELNKFKYYSKYEELRKLSKENGFIIKVRPSGQYYALIIEPIQSKTILEKVMSLVKPTYKDAFSNNYEEQPESELTIFIDLKKQIRPIPDIIIEQPLPIVKKQIKPKIKLKTKERKR